MAKQEPAVVRFEFDADEVQFPRFLSMAEDFLAVLREVDRDMAPGAGVQWVVETISKSSPLVLALRPSLPHPKLAPATLPRQLVKTINDGIRTVQRKAVRPPHFTDRALEKAKALVETAVVGDAALKVGTRAAPVRLNSQLVANVDAILGSTISSIGTIEGTLEAFNVHGARWFNVYDTSGSSLDNWTGSPPSMPAT